MVYGHCREVGSSVIFVILALDHYLIMRSLNKLNYLPEPVFVSHLKYINLFRASNKQNRLLGYGKHQELFSASRGEIAPLGGLARRGFNGCSDEMLS